MIARAESLLDEFPESSLVGQELNIVSIEDAALEGDPLAVQVAEEDEVALVVEAALVEEEEEPDLGFGGQRKRQRSIRRELVFDEELGEVVARRRRKRVEDEWDEFQ